MNIFDSEARTRRLALACLAASLALSPVSSVGAQLNPPGSGGGRPGSKPIPAFEAQGVIVMNDSPSREFCGASPGTLLVDVHVPSAAGPRNGTILIHPEPRLYQMGQADCEAAKQSVSVQKQTGSQGPFKSVRNINLRGNWVGCPSEDELCTNCQVAADHYSAAKPTSGTDIYRIKVETKFGKKPRKSCVVASWQTPP